MNLLGDAFAWLADPTHWSGPGSIPLRVGQHLAITAIAVVLASLVAIPLGIVVGHTGRGRAVVAALAGAARAIPTLGLLTLLALWLGIGLRAPLLALAVLAAPTLLAGCYAGIQQVDRAVVDSARATGFTPLQLVMRVEVPLAAPVIVGALRSATLQVLATATLAAYMADIGLGRYLFTGLKARDYPQMLAGALLVMVLALLMEVVMAACQRAAARRANPAAGRAKSRPRSYQMQGQL